MASENTWVTYLQRSYKTIKASLLSRMETLVPEITDRSESNIFVIILSAFAGLVEQLNYYIDNMARELYLTTARRYSSMVKLTRLIDYRIRAKVSATVDLLVTAIDSGDAPFNVTSDVLISAGTIVKTANNLEFITTDDRSIFIGNSSVSVPAVQGKIYSNQNIGTTTANPNQAFKLDPDYRHDSLTLSINSVAWSRVDSFAFSGPQDKHFMVEVNESKEAWVVFGDDVNGDIPPSGFNVIASFYKSAGLMGNVIEDTITTWVSGKPVGGGANDFTVTNPYSASGGLDVEGIEGIRKHAPLSLRTLDRAVTLQDHIDMALLVPGVGKVSVAYDPNLKTITLYVAPDGGGVASQSLLDSVKDYFADKKMISTVIDAKPCGLTYLRISITATAKFRRSAVDTATDIRNALLIYFGFNHSDVNKPIRRSDIIALVDNLEKVDFLTLNSLTTRPYPRITQGSHALDTYWYCTVNLASTAKWIWRIRIVNATTRTARLYRINPVTLAEAFNKEFTYSATDPAAPTINSTDGEISIGFFGTFTNADEWEFTSYPYDQDIIFSDYTVPVAIVSGLTISVNEQVI